MYPSHVVEGFGPLANYLLAPPTPHELSPGGGLSTTTQARIDKLVHQEVERRIDGFRLPDDHPRGINPAHRWRTVSSMQKAIRFRDCENATYAACIGWDMAPDHVLRRLGVISLEDVGAGSLFGVMMALASLGNSAWRKRVGERRLVVWLAGELADAPKDRTLCELCVLGNYDKGTDKLAMSLWRDHQLAEAMTNLQLPQANRMVAAWLLSGAHKFHGVTVPRQGTRTPLHLIRLMADHGLPRAMLYIAHKAASRLNEGMLAGLPFMHEMLSGTSQLSFHEPATFEPVMVGTLLGAAYDMHTREGLAALRQFAKEVAPVRRFVELVPMDERRRLIGFGVFLAEGARLASKLNYHRSDQLSAAAHQAELNSPGLPDHCHEAYLTAITDNIDKLNAIRFRLWKAAAT